MKNMILITGLAVALGLSTSASSSIDRRTTRRADRQDRRRLESQGSFARSVGYSQEPVQENNHRKGQSYCKGFRSIVVLDGRSRPAR